MLVGLEPLDMPLDLMVVLLSTSIVAISSMALSQTRATLTYEYWFTDAKFIKEKLLETLNVLSEVEEPFRIQEEMEGWAVLSISLPKMSLTSKMRERRRRLTEALNSVPVVDLQVEISAPEAFLDKLVDRFVEEYSKKTLRAGG